MYTPAADPCRFRTLFDSATFEEILAFGALRPGFLTVIHQGRTVSEELLFRPPQEVGGIEHGDLIDPAKVTPWRNKGATVVLSSLELYDRKVAEFSEWISRFMACDVKAYAFHTPAHSRGLTPHFDGGSGFLLQLEGSKHWTLHPPLSYPVSTEGGLPPEGWSPDDSQIRRTIVNAGDILYVPNGWIHYPETVDTHSLHLTFQTFPICN